MSAAREETLRKVQKAIGNPAASRNAEYDAIPRQYVRAGSSDSETRLAQFADRLRDYDATVYRCTESDIAPTIARALTVRGKDRLVLPPGLPQEWLPGGFILIPDSALTYEELDGSGGVITGCAAAIAQTGTIILRHTPEEGRRALTLIPDYHLCVVFAGQVVDVVSEGFDRMRESGSVPMTTISGPSATADIEMTRVKGVHGPRFFDVILVC